MNSIKALTLVGTSIMMGHLDKIKSTQCAHIVFRFVRIVHNQIPIDPIASMIVSFQSASSTHHHSASNYHSN